MKGTGVLHWQTLNAEFRTKSEDLDRKLKLIDTLMQGLKWFFCGATVQWDG